MEKLNSGMKYDKTRAKNDTIKNNERSNNWPNLSHL